MFSHVMSLLFLHNIPGKKMNIITKIINHGNNHFLFYKIRYRLFLKEIYFKNDGIAQFTKVDFRQTLCQMAHENVDIHKTVIFFLVFL